MSKIITRRNVLKAGIMGTVVLATLSGKGVYDCFSRQNNSTNSGLVSKLESSLGFKKFGEAEYMPIALAGQTQDAASFLLKEPGERRFFREDIPAKVGIYLMENAGLKRVGDLPVSPSDFFPQDASAIGQGNERYDCINLNAHVELRRTDLTKPLSRLLYKDEGGLTQVESAAGDLVLLRDNGRREFLLIDSNQLTPLNYKNVKKVRLPEGDEWRDLEGYMRKNTPPEFGKLINDYLIRGQTRIKFGSEVEKSNIGDYSKLIFTPSGISGDYGAIFALVKTDSGSYDVLRKKLEKGGEK